ncbi:MAG: Gfo/Idh/MocA family protein [Flavobacteriaceae bacterium]
MLKVGVVGCGHLGKIHTKLLSQSENYKLIGIYDKDNEESIQVSNEFKCTSFESFDSLLDSVDVIDIVAPTPFHFNYAKQAINKNKHVFIEKPVCTTSKESEELIKLGDLKKVKIQVGHVERFNPAFTKVESEISKPMFIESHRLAKFNPRGTDVSVVLDLMIHDIDIILKTVDSKVKNILSSGVSVISETPDIANARIEFENGCVANLTASRVSLKNMRKTRFFQTGKYISVDFLNKESEIVEIDLDNNAIPIMTLELANGIKKNIVFNKPKIKDNNAILDELNSFAESINKNKVPKVNITDGHNALDIALKIIANFK